MRSFLFAMIAFAPLSASAQEIHLTGPLHSGPSYRPTWCFASEAHLAAGSGTGVGLSLRFRPSARLGFDLVAESLGHEGTVTVPTTLRLVGFQRLAPEHDFFLAVGPTMRFVRGEDHHGTGAEAALGLETILGGFALRGEAAGFVVDDRGQRSQGLVLRLGVAVLFGSRVYRD